MPMSNGSWTCRVMLSRDQPKMVWTAPFAQLYNDFGSKCHCFAQENRIAERMTIAGETGRHTAQSRLVPGAVGERASVRLETLRQMYRDPTQLWRASVTYWPGASGRVAAHQRGSSGWPKRLPTGSAPAGPGYSLRSKGQRRRRLWGEPSSLSLFSCGPRTH